MQAEAGVGIGEAFNCFQFRTVRTAMFLWCRAQVTGEVSLMDNTLKLTLGIAAVALILGITGSYALADTNAGGMMGTGNFGANSMQNMMNGNLDMNAMHRAMHGEDPAVDMNAMHERMLAGSLTQEDIKEMQENCPMMR